MVKCYFKTLLTNLNYYQMKKSLLGFLALAGVLVGCQNYDDQFDALNQQILELQTELDGLTDIETDIATLATRVADIASAVADLQEDATDNASEIGRLLTELANLQSDVVDLNNAVSNIDVAGQVSSATAPIAAEVNNLEEEIDDIWNALQDLLNAAAVIEQDVRITNLAELTYAETLFTFNSTDVVTSVIVKGNVIITVADGGELDSTANLARINAITGMIGTIIQGLSGSDITLNNGSDTSIDFPILTYADGSVTLQGPSSIDAVTTVTGDLSFDAIEADISFPALTSVMDVIILSDVGITSIDLASIASVEGRLLVASETPSTSLILANATSVNIGGLEIPTVVDLAAGSFESSSDETDYAGTISATMIDIASAGVKNSVLTSSGAITVGNVASTTITADGAVTVASVSGAASDTTITGDGITINGAATANILTLNGGDITTGVVSITNNSSFTGSTTLIAGTDGTGTLTVNATGDSDVTVNGAIEGALTIADAADVTLGATTVSATTDITYSGTFAANSLVSINAQLDLTDTDGGHALELAALTTVNAAFNADDLTSITAQALATQGAAISVVSATAVDFRGLDVDDSIALTDAITVDFASISITTGDISAADRAGFETVRLHDQNEDVDFTSFTAVENITVIGEDNGASDINDRINQNNDVTVDGNANLETLTVDGYLSSLTVNATTLENITTAGNITVLTVTANASLTTLSTQHAHIQPGDAAEIFVKDNGDGYLTGLNFETVTKVKTVVVTGNDSVTLITAPSSTGLLAEPTAPISVTIAGAALAATYTAAVTGTQTTPYEPLAFSTSSIAGFKSFLETYINQTNPTRAAGTVAFSFDFNIGADMSGDADAHYAGINQQLFSSPANDLIDGGTADTSVYTELDLLSDDN